MIHLISTSMMVSLIWLIQILHYPSFIYVDRDQYESFQKFHMKKISFIVMPLMVTEFLTSAYILLFGNNENEYLFTLSFILLLVIWGLTIFIFSNIHQELSLGYNQRIISSLIHLNWIRTILWSLRLIILVFC